MYITNHKDSNLKNIFPTHFKKTRLCNLEVDETRGLLMIAFLIYFS